MRENGKPTKPAPIYGGRLDIYLAKPLLREIVRGATLDTRQSLLKLYHFLSQLPVSPHPVFHPCPNLGNSRVADPTEIPPYLSES